MRDLWLSDTRNGHNKKIGCGGYALDYEKYMAIRLPIRGFRFYSGWRLLNANYLRPLDGVCLIHEPTNIKDSNAIKVVHKLSGEKIGYIPRECNGDYNIRLRKWKNCNFLYAVPERDVASIAFVVLSDHYIEFVESWTSIESIVSFVPAISGVYAMEFIDCKQRYIGSSTDIKRRMMEHLSSMVLGVANDKIQSRYNESGLKNIQVRILWRGNEGLRDIEREFITEYNTFHNGLNCTESGEYPSETSGYLSKVYSGNVDSQKRNYHHGGPSSRNMESARECGSDRVTYDNYAGGEEPEYNYGEMTREEDWHDIACDILEYGSVDNDFAVRVWNPCSFSMVPHFNIFGHGIEIRLALQNIKGELCIIDQFIEEFMVANDIGIVNNRPMEYIRDGLSRVVEKSTGKQIFNSIDYGNEITGDDAYAIILDHQTLSLELLRNGYGEAVRLVEFIRVLYCYQEYNDDILFDIESREE